MRTAGIGPGFSILKGQPEFDLFKGAGKMCRIIFHRRKITEHFPVSFDKSIRSNREIVFRRRKNLREISLKGSAAGIQPGIDPDQGAVLQFVFCKGTGFIGLIGVIQEFAQLIELAAQTFVFFSGEAKDA